MSLIATSLQHISVGACFLATFILARKIGQMKKTAIHYGYSGEIKLATIFTAISFTTTFTMMAVALTGESSLFTELGISGQNSLPWQYFSKFVTFAQSYYVHAIISVLLFLLFFDLKISSLNQKIFPLMNDDAQLMKDYDNLNTVVYRETKSALLCKPTIIGLAITLVCFPWLFGVVLAYTIIKHEDNKVYFSAVGKHKFFMFSNNLENWTNAPKDFWRPTRSRISFRESSFGGAEHV